MGRPTYNPVTAVPGRIPLWAVHAGRADKDALLAFSWYNEAGSSQPVQVHRVTSTRHRANHHDPCIRVR